MLPTTAARKYARGAVQQAAGPDRLGALSASFHAFVELVQRSRELDEMLRHPGVPVRKKAEAAGAVLRAGGADPLATELVKLVVLNGHGHGLREVDSALAREVAAALGVVRAELRTARPASAADVERIAAALGSAVGSRVEVDASVDPSLIGGFVARAGDLVFDGSVKRQLERMRDELTR